MRSANWVVLSDRYKSITTSGTDHSGHATWTGHEERIGLSK